MIHPLRLPPPLYPGARVRVVASSWAVKRERMEAGLASLRGMGFEPVVPDEVWARDGYLAGSDDVRLAALVDAITDPDVDAIWAAAGGSGATRLLDGLDQSLLQYRAPWLIGFSDVTALHAAWHRAGVATLHGPVVGGLAEWGDRAREEVASILRHEPPPTLKGELVQGGAPCQGLLLGGNLSVLTALVGTGHLPRLEGALLLLEEVDERSYRLDRMLTQLRQAGVFDGVAGFVLGQLTRCEPTRGDARDALAVMLERLEDLGRPILRGVALGHEASARAAVLGARYRIHGDGTLAPVA